MGASPPARARFGSTEASSALARVGAFDGVLPTRVLRELRTAVVTSRARSHGTHWYALAASARPGFEQVIQDLRRHLPDAHEIVGAEWWFRASAADADFPFHFDRDEAIRTSVVSPHVASILYLGHAGGPTLVLDARPTRATAPTSGLAVHPRPGRFVMFPGALLHGVLPGRPDRWPRVTMLINWWRSVPRLERAAPMRGRSTAMRWRALVPVRAALEPIDPTRVMAKAAWLDVIRKQTSYR
jgi:hypothetical protein